jgi:spore coat protein CotH
MLQATRLAAAAATGLLIVCSSSAAAQTAAELFDPDTFKEIRLYVHSKDLQELRARYQENVYYTADLQWGRLRVRNIGIRARGRASRSAAKPGLRVDFDRYVTGQKFLGLRSLVLDNRVQDPSRLRESIGMALFARMGQPAPRESFCRLYINNVDHGVYAVVEAVEPELLARTLDEDSGYLFEYHYPSQPYRGEDLGDDLQAYVPLFEPRTHRLEPASVLYAPIRELIREVNHPVDAVWRERVERYIDLRAFVTHAAIEAFLSHQDGVLGYNGMNNFYLYRMARSSVHRLIPWDFDLAMDDHDLPIFTQIDSNPISRGALAYSDLRAHYLDVLRECARVSLEEDWLSNALTRWSDLIRPTVESDRLMPWSVAEFEESVAQLARFVAERPGIVLKAVADARDRE